MFYFILLQRANNLFYFIAAIRTTATFSCKTCRWAGPAAVYHSDLLLHQDNKRVAFCVVYTIKV